MKNEFMEDNISVDNDPFLYHFMSDLATSVNEDQKSKLAELKTEVQSIAMQIKTKSDTLSEASNAFMDEVKMSTKVKSNPFNSLEKSSDLFDNYASKQHNFVVLTAKVVEGLTGMYGELYQITKSLNPPSVLTPQEKLDKIKSFEDLQQMHMEIQINGRSVEKYANAIAMLRAAKNHASKIGETYIKVFEGYYQMLVHRHSTLGVMIHKNAVITDVAMQVFDNIDSHGEIEAGKNKNQVSAYTIAKAEDLARALKDQMMMQFVEDPIMLIDFVIETLENYQSVLEKLNTIFAPQIEKITGMFTIREICDNKLSRIKSRLRDMNPMNVSYVQGSQIKSESEQMMEDFRNESIGAVVEILSDQKADFSDLVNYVLERKAELRIFFHEENSFYVCKIGEGNSFLGQAPGALYVAPSERPKGDIDMILGSGFDEVREFAESIKSTAKWHDLFVATSPSGTADKSNVLLIGPQGCGKTEVMRAIGSQKDSIGIFAQGSDFLTCWMGEAQKNPKRLFDEGIRLNRESGRHVHFLIDEIDAVLNNDQERGSVNLTLEFQILMDGVVRYPNLSVWGATNNPDRIPMPMMRRFSKVLIVGELEQKDRVRLLRHFMGTMPVGEFSDERWNAWASRLEGATGDVIRKIADYLWRQKMNHFVSKYPTDAEKAAELIKNSGGIDKLDATGKKALHEHLRPIRLTEKDINSSIEANLTNVAVAAEISTAVRTYKQAKALLERLKSNAEVKETCES